MSYHKMVADLLPLFPGPFKLEKRRSSKASPSDAERLCSVSESLKGYLDRSNNQPVECFKVSTQKLVTIVFLSKNVHLFFHCQLHVSVLASQVSTNIFWIPGILLQLMSFRSIAGPMGTLRSSHRFGILQGSLAKVTFFFPAPSTFQGSEILKVKDELFES